MSYANVNNTEITKFEHNFCESRLQNNQPPELYNAYTSLAISVFPFVFGFPKHQPYVNIAYALTFNGFASFHYHYYSNRPNQIQIRILFQINPTKNYS